MASVDADTVFSVYPLGSTTSKSARRSHRFSGLPKAESGSAYAQLVRLWSLHPRYLDRQALVAVWREALLAQRVVEDPGLGYGRHPQLERFRAQPDPKGAVARFLSVIADEADRRGYRFDRSRISVVDAGEPAVTETIPVQEGQLAFEWRHLGRKLQHRSPEIWRQWQHLDRPDPHPLFRPVPGGIESWERGPVDVSSGGGG